MNLKNNEENIKIKNDGRLKRERKINTPLQRILTKIIIILCLILGISIFSYLSGKENSEIVVTKNYALVKESLTYWQEFVTLKYRYSDIVSIKKEGYFSTSYALVKYSGIIRAGIPDLTQCKINISSDGKALTIILPEAEILGNEIDTQEVFDEKQSIFVPLKMETIFEGISESKDLALQSILEDGILDDAKDYARKILTQIFITAGYETVEVK